MKWARNNEKNRNSTLITCIVSLMIYSSNTDAQNAMNKNQALNAKEQSIVTISALTAKGDLENLRKALNSGLDSGLTVNEIKEVPFKCMPTAAFRAVLTASTLLCRCWESGRVKA